MSSGPPARDPHSYARPHEARVAHVALDLTTRFQSRRLEGRAMLDVTRAPGATHIVLDTFDLAIARVTDADGGALSHDTGPRDPILGQALTIELRPDISRIVIDYATAPDAPALQWLSPEQTAGKAHRRRRR